MVHYVLCRVYKQKGLQPGLIFHRQKVIVYQFILLEGQLTGLMKQI